MKIPIKPTFSAQEERDLNDAIWKTIEGMRLCAEGSLQMQKVLTAIGERLGLEWHPENPQHVDEMLELIANYPPRSDRAASHFTNGSYWKTGR